MGWRNIHINIMRITVIFARIIVFMLFTVLPTLSYIILYFISKNFWFTKFVGLVPFSAEYLICRHVRYSLTDSRTHGLTDSPLTHSFTDSKVCKSADVREVVLDLARNMLLRKLRSTHNKSNGFIRKGARELFYLNKPIGASPGRDYVLTRMVLLII